MTAYLPTESKNIIFFNATSFTMAYIKTNLTLGKQGDPPSRLTTIVCSTKISLTAEDYKIKLLLNVQDCAYVTDKPHLLFLKCINLFCYFIIRFSCSRGIH